MTGPDLLLVRHGESTWNRHRRVQGQHPHPPLTARGREQARAAASLLAGAGAVGILASDAVRARQTAAIIGRRLGLAVRLTPLLRERHWGDLQGRSLAEADAADALLRDDEPVPGGESRQDVTDRLERLLGSPDLAAGSGPVVLVTHGDVIAQALRRGRAPLERPPANGSVTPISIERNDTRPHLFTPAPICARVSSSCSAREAGEIPAWSSPL